MIGSFIDGLVLGIGAAVPIGPVNLLIMAAALTSLRSGLMVGFGAVTADLFYLGLILFGLLNVPDFVMDLIAVFGSIFMVFMAYVVFKNRNMKLKQSRFIAGGSLRTFINGLLITLLNPYTIAFWVSASSFASSQGENTPFVVLGIAISTVAWVVFLPTFVYKSRGVLSAKVIEIFAIISALILVQIGIRLVIELFQ